MIPTTRGQPVYSLLALLVIWVAVRAAIWDRPAVPGSDWPLDIGAPPAARGTVLGPDRLVVPDVAAFPRNSISTASATASRTSAQTVEYGAAPYQPSAAALPPFRRAAAIQPAGPWFDLVPAAPAAASAKPLPVPVQTLAGHHLLWMAAVSRLPFPASGSAASNAAPDMKIPKAARTGALSSWSVDGWTLIRRGSRGPSGGFGQAAYGGSQIGAVIRYRLDRDASHRPAVYLRATRALAAPDDAELAAGISARPLPGVPVAALAELRGRPAQEARLRPAVGIVSEVSPLHLPLDLAMEVYAQAGWVGGEGATSFADGQLRVDRRIVGAAGADLRAGGAIWAGAQRGASRVDVGPSASLGLRLGPANARVAADWRFRIAGSATPGSGPAVTISAGF